MVGLLDDPAFSDVNFVVGNTRISSHRNVTCDQSEYFEAMLLGSFRESQSRAPKRAKKASGRTSSSSSSSQGDDRCLEVAIGGDALSLQGHPPLHVHRRAFL